MDNPLDPYLGREAFFISRQCALRVKIIGHDDLGKYEKFKLRVLEKMDNRLKCKYEEGQEFPYGPIKKGADPSGLEEYLVIE